MYVYGNRTYCTNHEMNKTLRIAMECHPLNLWFVEDSDGGKGVSWHGRTAWQLADLKPRLGLEYDVVTRLPPPEGNIYSDMLALVRGDADMSIDYWGVNYQRSLLVDFSYPQSHSGVYIFRGATGPLCRKLHVKEHVLSVTV